MSKRIAVIAPRGRDAEVIHGILRKALAPEIEEAAGALPLAAVIQKVMQAGAKGA